MKGYKETTKYKNYEELFENEKKRQEFFRPDIELSKLVRKLALNKD